MKDHRDRWAGCVVACVGSGPSLNRKQVALLLGRAKLIAINSSWRLAPEADALYAGDYAWWRKYRHEVAEFAGEKWSAVDQARIDFKVNSFKSRRGQGLPNEDGIFLGSDSGFQAIQLALWWGARRVVLLGFDQQNTGGRTHWHGNHPAPLLNTNRFPKRASAYLSFASVLKKSGREVVNCSPETSLTCFKRMTLEEALRDTDAVTSVV